MKTNDMIKKAINSKYVFTYYWSTDIIGLNFKDDSDMENFRNSDEFAWIAQYQVKSDYPRYMQFEF